MKITHIEVIPLTGATVDGGWPQGHEPQENLTEKRCQREKQRREKRREKRCQEPMIDETNA